MAPSVAHLHSLIARNARLVKTAWKNTLRAVQDHATGSLKAELQPLYIRNAPNYPIHPVAFARRSKGRWYSTHRFVNATIRSFTSSASDASAVRPGRWTLPRSTIGDAVYTSSGRAPFASTLRPNLTGGAFPRTAGGYGMGSGRIGGARYFSHTPTAPAQVINNVSQGVRALLLSGHKAQFDGVNPKTGEKRYRSVTVLQHEAGKKMSSLPRATPGSYVDFSVNPTITALTPLASTAGFAGSAFAKETLITEGLLDVLSVDFSRALKELSAVLNDLKRLSALGDLPITYASSSLRVHFPGCDATTVERLCLELGIQRGLVSQDEDFDAFVGTEIALLFPFAPSKTVSESSFYKEPVAERMLPQERIDWRDMMNPNSPARDEILTEDLSTRSEASLDFEHVDTDAETNSPPAFESSFESLSHADELGSCHSPLEYQGFEGVYRFMEQCGSGSR